MQNCERNVVGFPFLYDLKKFWALIKPTRIAIKSCCPEFYRSTKFCYGYLFYDLSGVKIEIHFQFNHPKISIISEFATYQFRCVASTFDIILERVSLFYENLKISEDPFSALKYNMLKCLSSIIKALGKIGNRMIRMVSWHAKYYGKGKPTAQNPAYFTCHEVMRVMRFPDSYFSKWSLKCQRWIFQR